MPVFSPLMSLATQLAAMRLSSAPVSFDSVRGPADEGQAYELQARCNAILASSLGAVAGLKIGCTTEVMRKFLGIDSPAAGEIFSHTMRSTAVRLSRCAFRKVGIECEIAVRIGETIVPGGPVPAAADVVEAVMAAAEIVDDRYADYKTLGVNWLIADNFFNAGAVTGDLVKDWRGLDLAALEGRVDHQWRTGWPRPGRQRDGPSVPRA